MFSDLMLEYQFVCFFINLFVATLNQYRDFVKFIYDTGTGIIWIKEETN